MNSEERKRFISLLERARIPRIGPYAADAAQQLTGTFNTPGRAEDTATVRREMALAAD
jgi:hypothetical protein